MKACFLWSTLHSHTTEKPSYGFSVMPRETFLIRWVSPSRAWRPRPLLVTSSPCWLSVHTAFWKKGHFREGTEELLSHQGSWRCVRLFWQWVFLKTDDLCIRFSSSQWILVLTKSSKASCYITLQSKGKQLLFSFVHLFLFHSHKRWGLIRFLSCPAIYLHTEFP